MCVVFDPESESRNLSNFVINLIKHYNSSSLGIQTYYYYKKKKFYYIKCLIYWFKTFSSNYCNLLICNLLFFEYLWNNDSAGER